MKMTTVYTRRGDQGETDLVGGLREKKTSERVEAYGVIDELNSQVGMVCALLESDSGMAREYRVANNNHYLHHVQAKLFVIGSYLATDFERTTAEPEDYAGKFSTKNLEDLMDRMIEEMPTLEGFVLPGGTKASAAIDVARAFCRRAERRILAFKEHGGEVSDELLAYMNRLSDYFFVLARYINYISNHDDIYVEECL